MCCVVFYDSKRDPERQYESLDECPVCGKSRWVEGKFRVEATKRYHHIPLKDVMASVYAKPSLLDEFVPRLDPGYVQGRVPDHITQTRGYAARLEKFSQFAHESRNLLINLSVDGVQTCSDKKKQYSITELMGSLENVKNPQKRLAADSMLLFGVIEGPKEPTEGTQACLDLLVDELLDAWDTGHTFVDSRTRELFVGRAMVLNVVGRPRARDSVVKFTCMLTTRARRWRILRPWSRF